MQTALLMIVAWLFPTTDKPSPDVGYANVEVTAKKIIGLARIGKGRILGSLVQRGMMREEVCRLLGNECGMFAFPSSSGAVMVYSYPDQEVNVYFCLDTNDEFRVDRVNFWSLRLFP